MPTWRTIHSRWSRHILIVQLRQIIISDTKRSIPVRIIMSQSGGIEATLKHIRAGSVEFRHQVVILGPTAWFTEYWHLHKAFVSRVSCPKDIAAEVPLLAIWTVTRVPLVKRREDLLRRLMSLVSEKEIVTINSQQPPPTQVLLAGSPAFCRPPMMMWSSCGIGGSQSG